MLSEINAEVDGKLKSGLGKPRRGRAAAAASAATAAAERGPGSAKKRRRAKRSRSAREPRSALLSRELAKDLQAEARGRRARAKANVEKMLKMDKRTKRGANRD